MTVRQLHKTLEQLMAADPNLATATVLQARDPEGNGTMQLANHLEMGHWKPRHDEFTPEEEFDEDKPLKVNAIVVWPR